MPGTAAAWWRWLLVALILAAAGAEGRQNESSGISCYVGNDGMLETMDALMGIYRKLHGEKWAFNQLTEVIGHAETGILRWGSCSTCTVPVTNVAAGRHGTISVHADTLPSYCCWRGVSCCTEPHTSPNNPSFISSSPAAVLPKAGLCERYSVTALQLWGLGLNGPFHSIMDELRVLHSHGLRHLDMSKNALTGTLPADLGSLSNLTHLLLGSNHISGTLPTSLREMRQLLQLDLEINKLTGSLNQGQLCPANDNSLKLLLIRGNNFSGPLDLRDCTQLQLADLQGNRFSGSLPVDGRNRALSVLRADHNAFNGTIPLGLWDLPSLMSLELTNNSLSGTLPKAIAAANFLTQLRLGNNKLAGTVPLAINTLSHLAELDLSDNIALTGTLPSMNWMLGLQSLSIRHTLLGGTIPRELADLPYLESVDVRDTRMTCCRSLEEAQERRRNGTLLPGYLTLDQVAVNATAVEEEYITSAGNMKCGMVKRAPHSSMVAQGWVSKPVNVSRQTWMVGPEYTWYMRCSCIKGYEPGPFTVIGTPTHCNRSTTLDVNGSAGLLSPLQSHPDPACAVAVTAVMTCKAVSAPRFNPSLVAGIVSAGGVLLLLMLLVHLSFKRLGRIKRQLEWWRKNLAGMPKCGEMSIVVTDIEGYSGMFKRAPEQMYRALTLHNNVIRHAKYVNCGSIIQQEGDSFTLAFHTAFDAVAFCLQVQLGLMEVPWPKGLMDMSDDGSSSHSSSADGGADKQQHQQGDGSKAAGSSSPPARRKLSQRLEGVSSILLSPGSACKLRKSRLATGSPTPPPPAFEALAAAAADAAGAGQQHSPGGSPKQPTAPPAAAAAAAAGEANRSSNSFTLGQPGNYHGGSGSSDGSGSSSSPTKQLADRCRRPACLQTAGGTTSSSGSTAGSMLAPAATAPPAAAAGGVDSCSPSSGALAAVAAGIPGARLASGVSTASKASYFSSLPVSHVTSTSSRFLSSIGVSSAASAASGLFRVGGSSSRGKHTGGADGSSGAAAGSRDGSSDGASDAGLFNGLRVRMGVVTGPVHWEACGAPVGSSAAAANSLAAIMNSSLYKLALEVSDAGNGGQVLLDAATFSRIKEELAPLGVVDANGIDYAQLEAARPFSVWQALWRGRRDAQGAGGRRRAQSDEAVVLDMGLWQKQQLPPTTPTSPAPASAAAAATAFDRTSLPGAMPQPHLLGGSDHHHHQQQQQQQQGAAGGFSIISPMSSTNGGSQDGGGGGWGGVGGWGVVGAGGWGGFWGSGAASTTGGNGGGVYISGGAHSCATAGSGSEHGCTRLRLYQVLPPSLAGRAPVWGDSLSLRGSWLCLDTPYFGAPGALFYSLYSHQSNGSYTAASRSSSMTKAGDTQHWQAKLLLQHQQLLVQHQQQQQQKGGAAAASAPGCDNSSNLSRQSSCIQAVHGSSSISRIQEAALSLYHQQQQQTQQTQQHEVYRQLTISAAADIEAPAAQDQQQQQQQQRQQAPSPLQALRSISSPAAAAAAVGAVPPLLLPAVTLMFVSVDGSKLLRKHHVRDVHCQLSLLFMEALRHIPGSYMCRMQAGDLKYMVAFASAPSALQWALLVQEAAMYLDYPPTFERVHQLRCEYDSRGQLVFRGPRLRIGICEGVPRTIMPDHLGRADYYGASVNAAARYMDAAAHGGQIACELDQAMAVLHYWSSSSNRKNCQLSGQHSSSSSSGQPAAAAAQQRLAPATLSAAAAAGASRLQTDSSSSPSTPASLQLGHDSCSNGSFTSSDSPLSSAPAAAAAAVSGQRRQLYHATSDASAASSSVAGTAASSQGCWGAQVPQQQQQRDVCLQQQEQEQVPTVNAAVEVQRLGAFRFKGGAQQQLQMANVTLAHLASRAVFIPAEPPRGKGERVSLGAGVAVQGQAPVPVLVQQYKARVPCHILQSPAVAAAAATAADGVDDECAALRAGSLRMASAPQHVLCGVAAKGGADAPAGPPCQHAEGAGEAQAEGGSGFELVEVLGLRQKSHSFTCPRSPGLT